MISSETKEVVKRFCDQYVWLRFVFDDYRVLYEGNPVRANLLHEVAPHFFYRLNRLFVHYILLNMCRLTDVARHGKNPNLTVRYILEIVGPEVREELSLEELSKSIHEIKPYIVDARNKAIAHLDKESIVSERTFGEFPKDVGDSFWEALQKFVDRVHKYCFGRILGDVVSTRGAKDLVEALRQAVHYDDYFKDKGTAKIDERQKMRYKDA